MPAAQIRQPTRHCAGFCRTLVPSTCRRTRPMRRSAAPPGRKRPITRKSCTRAMRRTASRYWSKPPPTTRPARCGSVRNIFTKGGGNLGTTGSVSFLFKKMGVFRLDPGSVKDQDELELDLIDHGLEEMGESTGDKGEPQLVIRCAFNDFGKLQEALEARRLTPLSAEHEYICAVPDRIAGGPGGRGLGADRQTRTGR